jgi:hypothetical protein
MTSAHDFKVVRLSVLTWRPQGEVLALVFCMGDIPEKPATQSSNPGLETRQF